MLPVDQMRHVLIAHGGWTETVWVECACGEKSEIVQEHGPSDSTRPRITEEDAAAAFRLQGWVLTEGKLPLCRRCAP